MVRFVGVLGQSKDGCRQNQGVWEVFCSGKRDRTDFLAQHTLLQVCHPVGAVLEKRTTIIAW